MRWGRAGNGGAAASGRPRRWDSDRGRLQRLGRENGAILRDHVRRVLRNSLPTSHCDFHGGVNLLGAGDRNDLLKRRVSKGWPGWFYETWGRAGKLTYSSRVYLGHGNVVCLGAQHNGRRALNDGSVRLNRAGLCHVDVCGLIRGCEGRRVDGLGNGFGDLGHDRLGAGERLGVGFAAFGDCRVVRTERGDGGVSCGLGSLGGVRKTSRRSNLCCLPGHNCRR